MEEECMIVDEVGKKGTGSPPLKKLKQSRLPFAPLDSKTPQKNSSPTTQKKRKLSGSDLSQNSPKTPRSENNSLNETPVSEKKLQTPKSAGSTNKAKTGDKLTPESTKKRGRGRPRKSLESKEVAQKSQKSSHPVTSDDEVSSSVDDDVDVPEPKKKPIEKTRKLLSSFLCKEPTQQAEVTTSTNLNDKEDIEQDDKENQTCKESEATKGEMEISSKGEEIEEKTSNNESEEKEETGKRQSSVAATVKTNEASSEAEKKENVEGKSPKSLDKVKDVEKQTEKTVEGKNTKEKGNVLKKKVNIGKKEPKKKGEKIKRKSEVTEKSVSNKIDKTDEREKSNNEEVKEEPQQNTNEGKEEVELKQSVDEEKLKKESKEQAAEEKTSKEKNQVSEKESDLEEKDVENQAKNEKEECKHEAKTEPNSDKKEDKTPDKHDKKDNNGEEEMEVDDLDTSSSSKSDGTGSANTSPSSVSKPSNNLDVPKSSGPSTPSTPSTPSSLVMKAKKLTPKQQAKEAERQQKREERERLRQEKEKKKQEELAEKERLKKIKEEEKQKAKEEKEKAKEEQKRKKQEEIEAKRLKREEEQQLKELEKMIREEEERQAEEEKKQKRDKLKNKFASFFVAKKKEPEENEENNSSGNFKEFRVKEDMQLAPLVRTIVTDECKAILTDHIAAQTVDVKETYLNVLRTGSYTPATTERTWPVQKKKEENDDIEIIEDDDEEVDAGDSLVQGPESGIQSKNVKAKLLHFCENRRPAYWGTWSKKSISITARRPFAKDEIFNYEYDSDDDWEEEETGESLSDSEGEEKEEEEGDQYEVDNDFFVPHGYLSDDEGKSDEEEEAGDKEQVEDDGIKSKERLKQKQAEFEEEMKKKTKHLKPRVIGSLWMADANENPAFKQLMKILNPYKAVTLGTRLPIGTHYGGVIPKDTKDLKDDDDGSVEDKGNGKKFCKTFPEEAVPALIKLLHGNRHGKIFLSREFSDFWRKFQAGELEEEELDHIPKLTTPVQASMFIAKKKVESKIQELGHWRKCPDEGPYHKVLMWYVPKHVREEYGVEDITVPNSWNYINKPKEKREVCFDDPDTAEENKKDKAGKLMPITAFTKKLPATPSSSTTSPTSTPTTPQVLKSSEASPANGSPAAVTPSRSAGSPSSNTGDTPSGKSGTPGQPKKKVALFSVPRNQEITDAQKASFVSFFKKNAEKSANTKSESLNEKTSDEKISPSDQNDDSIQCITLD